MYVLRYDFCMPTISVDRILTVKEHLSNLQFFPTSIHFTSRSNYIYCSKIRYGITKKSGRLGTVLSASL